MLNIHNNQTEEMGSNSTLIALWITFLASYLAWWPVRIGHPWVDILSLLFLALAFLLFPLFLTFLFFLNFPAFHTFLLFLFYPAFWIYVSFLEIFLFSHFWHHFWTLVLTWLLLQVIARTLSTILNWWANFSIYSAYPKKYQFYQ